MASRGGRIRFGLRLGGLLTMRAVAAPEAEDAGPDPGAISWSSRHGLRGPSTRLRQAAGILRTDTLGGS